VYLALQKKARAEGRPTDEFLQLHALECWLDRLATSRMARDVVLKGGVLLAAYDLRRPTRDIDLSTARMKNDAATLLSLPQACRPSRVTMVGALAVQATNTSAKTKSTLEAD
jgi:hypothetical protein